MKLHTTRCRYRFGERAFTLLELALSLAVTALLLGSFSTIAGQLESRAREREQTALFDRWMTQLEAFALTRRRLPCPSTDLDGTEQQGALAGACAQSAGRLPWRSLGLQKPQSIPFYAVATLETLGTPMAYTLTRTDGYKSVPQDLLSAAIFGPPDTTGTSPGTLPALLVKDTNTTDSSPMLAGMPCAGNRFMTVSAVAIVASGIQDPDEFSGNRRCFTPPAAVDRNRMRRMEWLSYERLMWLYLNAGLSGTL